jgi:hypothetical protein
MSLARTVWATPEWPSGNGHGYDEAALEAIRPISLREIVAWETKWRRMLFRVLLPTDLLVQFGIDPITLADPDDRPVVRVTYGGDERGIRFELFHAGDAPDPMIELELADNQFNQIEVVWLALQDPRGSRFDVDVTVSGESNMRGIMQRNLPAEEAALAAGLAPGQIRRGLGAFTTIIARLETFMSSINQREYICQPLFYHTAVLFERIGCSYVQGHARMLRIDRGFAPGGDLRARLDRSSPFRMPALADSVRGRAWAIHGGILEEPWDRVRMVKRLGVDADVDTCPGLPW